MACNTRYPTTPHDESGSIGKRYGCPKRYRLNGMGISGSIWVVSVARQLACAADSPRAYPKRTMPIGCYGREPDPDSSPESGREVHHSNRARSLERCR